jgi:acetylornithine deacetylase/succinyl-diaminopimelate desuccinylase-like protein
LRELVDDDDLVIESVYEAVPSPASLLSGQMLETIEALVESQWPGIMVVPEMSAGATDGLYVRNAGIPVYGIGGWFMRPDEVRAHGLDEKISIRRFHEGTEFWYRMLKEFSH